MNALKKICGIGLAALACANCGSGGPSFSFLQQPVDIKASSADVTFDRRAARFLYVADAFSGAVTVIDQEKEEVIDTDANSDFRKNPVPVGGSPSAIAVQDRTSGPRVFAADALNRRLIAFDAVPPSNPSSKILEHTAVDLGGSATGIVSRAMFKESGRTSTPTLTEISAAPSAASNENWEVEFQGGGDYKVKGSKSGEQKNRARENTAYTSDNGAISFTIVSGGERTTAGDLFRFGTAVVKPLSLTGIPVDLQMDTSNLYVVTSDPAELVVLNLQSLTVTSTVTLSDGSGSFNPGRGALGGGHLYLPSTGSTNVLDINLSNLTTAVIAAGVSARSAGLSGQTLFLMPLEERSVSLWDLSAGSALSSIPLSDYGLNFTPYQFQETAYGLIPTAAGGVDLIDVAQRARLDAHVSGGATQSTSGSVQFFDVLPASSPDLISVTTNDTQTRTERWQLVYEGVIPGASERSATVSGTQVTVSGAQFQTIGIRAGDLVTLDLDGDNEEVAVADVSGQTTLTLASAPQTQGSTIIRIRCAASYVVIGSESGLQTNRVTEGTPYTSDTGAISLTIRASRGKPTTRDDFFTFLTTDGTDAIPVSNKRLGAAAAVCIPPNKTVPYAFVAQEGTGDISAINLLDLREKKTIR